MPGTELDLDEYEEMIMMKRKMIDDLEDDEIQDSRGRSKRQKVTHTQRVRVENRHEQKENEVETNSHIEKVEDTQDQTQTHKGRRKHTHNFENRGQQSTHRDPFRSNNSRNLKTVSKQTSLINESKKGRRSKRGSKDTYLGESIKSYFKTLRSDGADRNVMKGKTRPSLGHQEGDQDELTGDTTDSGTLGVTEAVETDTQKWKDLD